MKQTVDWHSYWTGKRPGFHEASVNVYLQQFFPQFNLQPQDGVFLPLCGKAHDIQWLAQQDLNVVGVELSEVAIKSFFEEWEIDFDVSEEPDFRVFRSPNITLYQGDYMHLKPEHLAHCKMVYDRASIVAIEPFNRQSYVNQLLNIVPQQIPILMVTLEYDQSVMSGPPFSVPVKEIEGLFEPDYRLTHLITQEQINERERWRDKGLKSLLETALRLDAR
jgi:thiopurine S-methyltransferase